MRALVLCLLALAAASPASAQYALTPAPNDGSVRTLTVTGEGEAEAPADYAVLRFAVTTEGESVDEAQRLHQTEVDRVQALLRTAGVPENHITLDRLSLDNNSEERNFPGRSSNDDAIALTRAVTVEIDDLDSVVGLVVGLASDVGDDALAVQTRSVSVGFDRRDVTALRDEALREAVRDARRRADLAAEAAGVRIGSVLSVTEAGVTGTLMGGGLGSDEFAAMMGAMGGGRGVGSGTRTEAVRIVVVYAVE